MLKRALFVFLLINGGIFALVAAGLFLTTFIQPSTEHDVGVIVLIAIGGIVAYLLELLSDFQITIPEIGTVKAKEPPVVIITSNRTREIHDALKRRCLYHWVDFPSLERELEIVRLKAPGAADRLYVQVVEFVQRMRTLDLFKAPGVAETIDWTNALVALNAMRLDPATASQRNP